MKLNHKFEQPFIAIYFKALSVVCVTGALFALLASGGLAASVYLYVIFGCAPIMWWMGELVSLLARIASRPTASEPKGESKPSRAELEAMLGGPAKKRKDDDDDSGGVPKYTL